MANNQINNEYVQKGYLKTYLANRGIKVVDYDEWERLCDCIDDAKAADVRENVRGEWIIRKCALGHEYTECSNCNTVFDIKTHNGTLEWIDLRGASYCPNCGADMRTE